MCASVSVCLCVPACVLIHLTFRVHGWRVQVSSDNVFDVSGYFTWIYLGSQQLSHLFTALIIIGFLLITCFPIWPRILKVFCVSYIAFNEIEAVDFCTITRVYCEAIALSQVNEIGGILFCFSFGQNETFFF